MYAQSRPGLALTPYIEMLWSCEGYRAPHRRERVLPNGRFQLVFDLAGPAQPVVIGIQTGYGILETANLQSLVGVVFLPGGAQPFFDLPADALANRAEPLDSVWGISSGAIRDRMREEAGLSARFRILESALLSRLRKPAELHPAVLQALAGFHHGAHIQRIGGTARDAGLSRRRFAQLFREQVGLAPKLYCRLRRFQQVVRHATSGGDVDWADIALAGGYYDQAHMAHEFREFAGISPGAWHTSQRPFQNHAVLD